MWTCNQYKIIEVFYIYFVRSLELQYGSYTSTHLTSHETHFQCSIAVWLAGFGDDGGGESKVVRGERVKDQRGQGL